MPPACSPKSRTRARQPTNHLDVGAIRWLEGLLSAGGAAAGTATFVVTHDRAFIDAVGERIVELDRGRAYGFERAALRGVGVGDSLWRGFVEAKSARLAAEDAAAATATSQLRRELAWLAQARGLEGNGSPPKGG